MLFFLGAHCDCTTKSNNCKQFSDNDRKKIFDDFWQLSWIEKSKFVANLCKKSKKEKYDGDMSRNFIKYHLPKLNKNLKVCKMFFKMTLDIGDEAIKRMLNIKKTTKKTTKLPNITKNNFKLWLRSLPKTPSHYCRKNSDKLYLTTEFKNKIELFEEYKR